MFDKLYIKLIDISIKPFHNRETIPFISISPLADIPSLYHDCVRSLN